MNRWMLALVVFAVGCAPKSPPQPVAGAAAVATRPSAAGKDLANELEEVSIDELNGWYLRIKPAGNGIVGYGSSGEDGQTFPPGTFDFAQVVHVLEPLATVPGFVPTPGCNFAFFRRGEQTATTWNLKSRTLVLPWFRKAFDAMEIHPSRMDEIWKLYPPAGPDGGH